MNRAEKLIGLLEKQSSPAQKKYNKKLKKSMQSKKAKHDKKFLRDNNAVKLKAFDLTWRGGIDPDASYEFVKKNRKKKKRKKG